MWVISLFIYFFYLLLLVCFVPSKSQSLVYNYAIIIYELSLNYIHLTLPLENFLFKKCVSIHSILSLPLLFLNKKKWKLCMHLSFLFFFLILVSIFSKYYTVFTVQFWIFPNAHSLVWLCAYNSKRSDNTFSVFLLFFRILCICIFSSAKISIYLLKSLNLFHLFSFFLSFSSHYSLCNKNTFCHSKFA